MQTLLQEELRWPSDDELALVATMRSAVGEDRLAAQPVYISHDVNMCRFLRGNEMVVDRAIEKINAMLQFREENVEFLTNVQNMMRSTSADGEEGVSGDMNCLPHAKLVLQYIPFQAVDGTNAPDGLPVTAVVARLLNLEMFSEIGSDKIREFLMGLLEQKHAVLHFKSVAEHRMVKFVEIRDAMNFNPAMFLTDARGRRFASELKSLLQSLQDFYPEVIHKAVMFNAPSTIHRLVSFLSHFMNARMMAKMAVLSPASPFQEKASYFDARALHAILAVDPYPAGDAVLAAGSLMYKVKWLNAGDSAEWMANLVEGSGAHIAVSFLPFAPGQATMAQVIEEAELGHQGERSGCFIAPETATNGGLLVLCVDNTRSWVRSKSVSASVQ